VHIDWATLVAVAVAAVAALTVDGDVHVDVIVIYAIVVHGRELKA
jgi:hypothetical protein